MIKIKRGGIAALLASAVRNEGSIIAPLGTITLAAGRAFTIDFSRSGLVQVKLPTESVPTLPDGRKAFALVENSKTGVLEASGGRVMLTGRAVEGVLRNTVNTDGVISVRSFERQGGTVILSAGTQKDNMASGQTIAGNVTVGGVIDASSDHAAGVGGRVLLSGDVIAVTEQAEITATGAAGGEVLIGGDYQGAEIDYEGVQFGTARFTHVAKGAEISVDGLVNGDGGRTIVWADKTTAFMGTITGQGGIEGGDGGFAEVSGHERLIFKGQANLLARTETGIDGKLLLDPTTITICNSCAWSSSDLTLGAIIEDDGSGSVSTDLLISDLLTQLNLGDVEIRTASSGPGSGGVYIKDDLIYNGSSDRLLTIIAEDGISLNNQSITSTNAKLSLDFRAKDWISLSPGAGKAISLNGGDFSLEAGKYIYAGGSTGSTPVINTGGGNLTAKVSNGKNILKSIDTGGGDLTVNVVGSGWSILENLNAKGGDIDVVVGPTSFIHLQGIVTTSGTGHIHTTAGNYIGVVGPASAGNAVYTSGSGDIQMIADSNHDGTGGIGIVGGLNSTGSGSVSLSGVDIILAESIGVAGGDITLTGNVVQSTSPSGNISLETNRGGAVNGGDIIINGTITSNATDRDLILRAGTSGAINITGDIDLSGGPADAALTVEQAGSAVFNGNLSLGGDLTLSANEGIDLRGRTSAANITVNADLDGNGSGDFKAHNLITTNVKIAANHAEIQNMTVTAFDVSATNSTKAYGTINGFGGFEAATKAVMPNALSHTVNDCIASGPPCIITMEKPNLGGLRGRDVTRPPDHKYRSGLQKLSVSAPTPLPSSPQGAFTLEDDELRALAADATRGDALVEDILALLGDGFLDGKIPKDAFKGQATVLIPDILDFQPRDKERDSGGEASKVPPLLGVSKGW